MDPQTYFSFKKLFHKYNGQGLRLVRLVETTGATYRKAGALKLIHESGESEGLISGGCLESEIIERSIHEKEFVADTSAEEDRLLGYGLGCQGRLTLSSESVPNNWSQFSFQQLNFTEKQIPDLHVVGGGSDAQILIELVSCLNWPFTVYDYRTLIVSELKKKNFPIMKVATESIPSFKNSKKNIFILMSHSYEYDLGFLNQASQCESPFIGILGPQERKDQMINDLEKFYDHKLDSSEHQNIFAPIGSKELGRGPQAIAISIITELQKKCYAHFK